MKNPHIIVDPRTRRCLCGVYDGYRVSCEEIINELDGIALSLPIRLALQSPIQDCSNEDIDQPQES